MTEKEFKEFKELELKKIKRYGSKELEGKFNLLK